MVMAAAAIEAAPGWAKIFVTCVIGPMPVKPSFTIRAHSIVF
jgi:hypothetical protein